MHILTDTTGYLDFDPDDTEHRGIHPLSGASR